MEGLKISKVDLTTYLPPSSSNVQKGLLHQLSSILLRFNEKFDGVVLSFHDLKIKDKKAVVLSGLSPYFGVKLKAKLLLFSPKPGMLLEGTVNKLGKDYIGVIVLGIFNAAIAITDIREEFHYEKDEDGEPIWVSTDHGDHVIRTGTVLRFLVESVTEDIFIEISGSLKPSKTGCVRWLSSHEVESASIPRRSHKKHKSNERKPKDHDSMQEDTREDSNSHKMGKAKRKRLSENVES
ncbi:DNA-directed RNA polymerase I subunit rpa43 isoform X2 [Amborella trichopoda]|uniref:DNA-directed RNA polymerase subunit n=1 Tax=Amborella trichopoda TaxID=13333 RepID=W1NR12_AMBTC|nr:DNA-directed RNA polymerase I subunit rpa43 isoform X2 [Amborella trichopoda]XP_011629281.1 DNA-directed RNA polymerase I subunit rpa43 isoform X2 [Amborella trichopoda]ERM97269.1 hypothetical protein AMTR_s00119p00123540 [Amborella trichopoda]|eukprot:XP_006829853.1 DNA-directed RNA polymerase I subunit rpa43 isoform X2 [Amborella trichopoda]